MEQLEPIDLGVEVEKDTTQSNGGAVHENEFPRRAARLRARAGDDVPSLRPRAHKLRRSRIPEFAAADSPITARTRMPPICSVCR